MIDRKVTYKSWDHTVEVELALKVKHKTRVWKTLNKSSPSSY